MCIRNFQKHHYNKTMTVRDLLREGTDKLNKAGIENAAFDARQLLMRAYGQTGAELAASMDRELCAGAVGGSEPQGIDYCPGDCSARADYEQYISKRTNRIPLQHILGTAVFMGLEFRVDSEVLIPRQDTESLVETVLKREQDKDIRLLDLCTGSGCIATALKVLGGYISVSASDVSEEALTRARDNARSNKAEIDFILSDMFENISDRYDVIVSNPPYIPSKVIDTLEPEVRVHDPKIALDGGADGLHYYYIIANDAAKHLNTGGRLYLEIGAEQGESVRDLLWAKGYTDIEVIQDLSGRDRVVASTLKR